MSMKEEQELCQAFSEVLLDVQDVDEQDADQPQLCSEYVKDIYNYLRDLEVICFPTQPNPLILCFVVCITAMFVSTGTAGCTSKLHAGL